MKRIEVVISEGKSPKEKGDLLENFTAEFLKTQNYNIIKQVRVTSAELDLLCRSKINDREIYVECKAHRENLNSDVLRKLLGTVILNNYSEGWLISTAEFGKDAKGFIEQWKKKPSSEAQRLSFFNPEKLIHSFINSHLIIDPEKIPINNLHIAKEELGNWTLIISNFGNFWALECLKGGIPSGLIIFYADTGKIVEEIELLNNLSKTDSSLRDLDFTYLNKIKNNFNHTLTKKEISSTIVPLQQGESWDDYRPARPEDFVGRHDSQNKILKFFDNVINNKTDTRVFAITGNSGMGKSSLIAKIRARCRNKFYKNKYFLYAVDVRAAKDQSYIYNSIIKCFQEAIDLGFISNYNIKITDYFNPFSSDSIQNIFSELKSKNKLICLVFDQFEELYSKPELYTLFEKVKNLLYETTSIKENFILGFAWKTDSTVYQDHPAYHFWHSLRDQRYTIDLQPFTKGDSEKVLSIFEKQINTKLPKDLRHQLITHSQGYPWLLKKLCIHLYNKFSTVHSLEAIINENLDIKVLFDKDLQELSQSEHACLKLVAQKAPVDWYEITEISGSDVLKNLIEKRLVIRSGERLIIYWDIFKEYLLTGKVPSLPFNYLPLSPSLNTFIKAVSTLKQNKPIDYKKLSEMINVSEGTSQNIVSDLFMFNIAEGNRDSIILKKEVDNSSEIEILKRLKNNFKSHIIVQELQNKREGIIISQEDIIEILKKHNPTAQHSIKTWRLYANRIGQWLSILGYITPHENYWLNKEQDLNSLNVINIRKRPIGSGYGFTIFNTSPQIVIELLKKIQTEKLTEEWIKLNGYKNAYIVLKRLSLIRKEKKIIYLNYQISDNYDFAIVVKKACNNQFVFKKIEELINNYKIRDGLALSKIIDSEYNMGWSEGTVKRVGYSLFKWYKWLKSDKV